MLTRILIFAFSLMLAQTVYAEQKIGFIDAQRILKNAPQVVNAREKLESQFKPRREELQRLFAEIEEQKKEVFNEQDELGEAARKRKAELVEMQRNYSRLEDEIAEDMNLQRNLILRDLQKLVSEEVLRIAEEEGFDLIVQDVVFASKRIDITDYVLSVLEERAKN